MAANNLDLSELENSQLKATFEYFFWPIPWTCSYSRFEQCFQPLFKEANIPRDSIFKEICGPKKKYINYPCFVNAYKKYKSGNVSNDLKFFFYKLLNEILVKKNYAKGESPEICFRYSKAHFPIVKEAIYL